MAGNGFRPIGIEGRGYNGQLTPFWIAKNYATSIFNGDPVMLVADGTIEVINSVTDMNLGNMVGVFMGCEYVNATSTPTWNQYYPASQDVDGIIAYVAGTDPLNLVGLANVDGGDSPSTASADTTYTHGIVIVEPTLHMYSNSTGI